VKGPFTVVFVTGMQFVSTCSRGTGALDEHVFHGPVQHMVYTRLGRPWRADLEVCLALGPGQSDMRG